MKFSGYYFCMDKNILGYFEICISVSLSNRFLATICQEHNVDHTFRSPKVPILLGTLEERVHWGHYWGH